MRFTTVAAALACASSAFAYTIIVPSTNQPWTDQGDQPFSWQFDAANDRQNFTVLIQNPNPDLLPQDQVLAALVNGNLGNMTVRPPSGGWIPGPGFRIQIVDSASNLTGVLAESQVFDIEQSTMSASSTRTTAFSTTLRNTATENPDAVATDDTLPADDGSAFAFKAPAAVAAALALVPALFL
ncbi:GPI-anchored small secreted protein [Coprinopsis sp. MPI-PUGE-AT-0042]|nr:GPI-anchored small secreted protein [Coprinopsis sp. MPI-PUGE-AT-0042]